MAILEDDLLVAIPEGLRGDLLAAYQAILRNFRERRWEPSELNGGKLCEVVYAILSGHTSGKFPKKASKPRNMVDACRALERASGFPRSIRIQIPRMLVALYEVRNNRGVGHVGGDVDPNHMDAACVVQMCKWLVSELVRVFHGVSVEEAASAVDAIVERSSPVVWKVGEQFRILQPGYSMRDKTLLLLYHRRGSVAERDLFDWVEHSNAAAYRRDILKRAHEAKLLEYNRTDKTVEISPIGIEAVESELLE